MAAQQAIAVTIERPGDTPHFVRRPVPQPGPGETVVEVSFAALDALDARIAAGRGPGADAAAKHIPGAAFPLVPGRGAVGRVVDADAAAKHLLGAAVVVPSLLPCGECDACRRARAALCRDLVAMGRGARGSLCTHVVAPARWLLPLSGELAAGAARAREMALLPVAADLYQAVAFAGVGAGDAAMVVGEGFRPNWLRALLVAKGAHVIEADDRATAEVACAAREAPRAGWKIFACGGAPLCRAVALLGPAATLVLCDETTDGAIDAGAILAAEAQVRASRGAHPDLYPEVAALVLRGEPGLPALDAMPFDRAADALRECAGGEPALVQVDAQDPPCR